MFPEKYSLSEFEQKLIFNFVNSEGDQGYTNIVYRKAKNHKPKHRQLKTQEINEF